MPQEKQYITIDENLQYIEDPEQVRKDVRAIWEKGGIQQVTFRHKLYPSGPLYFRWYMVDENKIIGTVFPA
jgi:hypothetical protein